MKKTESGILAYKKAANTKTDKEKDEEVIKNLPLVHKIVNKMVPFLPPHVEKDDLFHAGVIGLMDAINKFDATKNNTFSTYAYLRIRGSILDELRARDAVSRSSRSKITEYKKSIKTLSEKLGRVPKDFELAEHMGVDENELLDIEKQSQLSNQVSLDKQAGENSSLSDFVQEQKDFNPMKRMEDEDNKKILAKVLGTLKEQEKLVVKLYYFEDMLMKEIALVLEVTESRVCQIHSRVMSLMKSKLIDHGIDSI